MARNRTIYQSEALFVSRSPATGRQVPAGYDYPLSYLTGWWNQYDSFKTGQSAYPAIRELLRVQSCNYSYNIPRTDINQFNQLSAIDRVILEQPTVSLDFSYILANMNNERRLGFTMSTPGSEVSAISGILNKTEDEKNYYILTVPEGNDAADYAVSGVPQNAGVVTFGIGNGFLTSYSSEGSVGNFPTVSVNVEALNLKVDTAASGVTPAVNPQDGSTFPGWFYFIPNSDTNVGGYTTNQNEYSISAIRPGDITLSLGTEKFGPDWDDIKVQNYTISFDLNREPLQKLGSKYAFSREITFPVTATLSVTADVGDVVSGNLATVITEDSSTTYNPTISMKQPGASTVIAWYKLAGAKLDSMEMSSSIGPNKSVTLTFSSQIGGPQNNTVGLFMSGFGLTT